MSSALREPSERRAHERHPIRLKVVYRTAQSLVTEYTTSVSKGGCRVSSRRPLEAGTEFLFEMYAKDTESPVQMTGQIVRCTAQPETGLYELAIEYVATPEQMAAMERVLERMLSEHQYERARRHPRVPVNLVAEDGGHPDRRYLVRDVSESGLGLRLSGGDPLPGQLRPGQLAWVELALGRESSRLAAKVVWVAEGQKGHTQGAVGLAFTGVDEGAKRGLSELMRLRRPDRLRITFAG